MNRQQEKQMMKSFRVVSVVLMIIGQLSLASAFAREAVVRQKIFTTAETAVEALGAAYECGDLAGVARILGDDKKSLVSSGDPVVDRHELEWFKSLYMEKHGVSLERDDRAILLLGKDEYPYPIPIVKGNKGWRFEPSEGHEDLISRRISKAELSALDLVVSYVEAQRAYVRQDHDGDGILEYARRFRSSPGRHDGLYWEEKPGHAPSPLAALVSFMAKEGYKPAREGDMAIYRGYFYKILKAQGTHAPGGACEYEVNGKMTGGFALAAFPVRYGISGVLTFMVNKDGAVYQKDLGPETAAFGNTVTVFDPDETWTKGVELKDTGKGER